MLLFQYIYDTLRICLFFFAEEIDSRSSHQGAEHLPYGIIERDTGNTSLQSVFHISIESLLTDFYQIKKSGMSNGYALGFARCTRGVYDVGVGGSE